MQPHVHFHAARCGEALQTALALKGLDARVCFHVCCERALHGESSKALLALERLLVGVDADVAHKVTGLLEFLGAIWTAVPADAVLLPDGACTVKRHGGGAQVGRAVNSQDPLLGNQATISGSRYHLYLQGPT